MKSGKEKGDTRKSAAKGTVSLLLLVTEWARNCTSLVPTLSIKKNN